mmetsp:Transcript_6870/g.8184  ORF Transcript_6870/g.8184 Transcript_6870/m.8184 type:complete len:144 (-) Transcript_6870:294-725(-)
MGLTDKQKTAIVIWSILTGLIWVGWLFLRLSFGGMCERPELTKDFDSKKYLGRWYEIYRGNNVPFEENDCATATYIELPNNYIEVNNVEYNLTPGASQGGISDPGKAHCSSFRSGHCQVKFFEASPWSDYSVLYTDFTTHTIV